MCLTQPKDPVTGLGQTTPDHGLGQTQPEIKGNCSYSNPFLLSFKGIIIYLRGVPPANVLVKKNRPGSHICCCLATPVHGLG